MYEKNRLLAMLGRNEVPLGMQSFTGNPALIEVMGLAGFDFVMIDTEHSGNDPRAMEPLIRAAEWAGLFPFVRVSGARNEVEIRRALEAGALGLFLPEVDGPEDVQIAADAAFFPPKGHRGICPAVRAARYNFDTFQDYTAWNNAEISLVPMIENPRGVENVDEICSLEDVKMVVIGAGDLGFSVAEGTSMLKGRVVQEDYRKVLEAAKRHNVAVIGGPVLDATPESCRKAFDDGVRIFSLGLDTMGFRTYCEQVDDAMGKGTAGTGFRRPPKRDNGFDSGAVAGQQTEETP